MPTDVFVGLGSNIDPERHLTAAVAAIGKRASFVATSPVYRSAPVGFTGNDFLNMVLQLRTSEGPRAVEDILSRVEREHGRRREGAPSPVGPRTLDLDLLLFGSVVDPALRLPRDDVLRYAFVLRPLADLAPLRVHPVTGLTLGQEWAARAGVSPPLRRVPLALPR